MNNKINVLLDTYKESFEMLNKINHDVKVAENALRKCKGISSFYYHMEHNNFDASIYMVWESKTKRINILEKYDESGRETEESQRPFIECKREERLLFGPFLDAFIDEITKFIKETNKNGR